MKLRYQLRGLGIGMVLTALLMGVAAGDGTSMSDAEIKARALELGMVESDSLKLTDIVSTQAPNSGAVPTQVPTSNPDVVPTQSPELNDGAVPTQTPSSDSDTESAQTSSSNLNGASTQASSSNSGDANMITIVIEQGEIASEICVKLEEAGIIEDAAVFETYLCENNWSRSIRDGIYNIPLGTSMEDVAGIIIRNP